MPKPTKHTTQYKQTPIGLLPKHWEVEAVCNVFEFLPTNSFSRENLTYNLTKSKIYNIHYGDIHSKFNSEILDCESELLPFIKDELIITQNFYFIHDGDLVIADASEDYEGVGECVEIKNVGSKKIVSGLHTFLARDNSNKTAIGFRTYIFRNQKVNIELKKIATGISVFSISKTSLNKLKIPIPPIPEQQRIATILSTWDKAIEHVQRIIEQLQLRNKGLAQVLLNNEKCKMNNWEWKKLGDEFERVTLKNEEGNKNVVTISAQRGFIRQSDFFNKTVASEILDNYYLVHKGEFCYNKSYSNGYDWGATKRLNDFDKAVVTTLYICFKLKNSKNNFGDFFEHYFENGILNKGLSKVANEGGRAHGLLNVTPSDFFNIKIPIPPLQEQQHIATILDTAQAELTHYQQKLQQLQIQKKGLMQQLLTGKVLTVKL